MNSTTKRLVAALSLSFLVAGVACSSSSSTSAGDDGDDDSCNPGDQDGVVGGNNPVHLTVSDTDFSVGAPDSGSVQRQITVQNFATVELTLTNVGTKPHSFVVQCLPTPNTKGCPTRSCFPASTNIPAVAPGASATSTFTTPATEGAYTFISDVAGDFETGADGGPSGLFGQINLM